MLWGKLLIRRVIRWKGGLWSSPSSFRPLQTDPFSVVRELNHGTKGVSEVTPNCHEAGLNLLNVSHSVFP